MDLYWVSFISNRLVGYETDGYFYRYIIVSILRR